MAGGFERFLVGGNLGVQRFCIALHLGDDFLDPQPGRLQRAVEVSAFVPVLLPAPDHPARFGCENQPRTASGSGLPHARHTPNIRLVFGDLPRRHVLDDGIGPRRAEGNFVELSHADHVPHGVAEPVRVVPFEEIWLPDRKRVDGPQSDLEIELFGHPSIATDRKIAVGRTKAEIELCGKGHACLIQTRSLSGRSSSIRPVGPLSSRPPRTP